MNTDRIITGLVAFSLVLTFAACGTAEIEQLSEEKQRLEARLDTEREAVQTMLLEMEEVQKSMRQLTAQEGLLVDLTTSNEELSKSPKERVLEDIALIDKLFRDNQEKIGALEAKVKRGEGRIYEFERVVANLKLDLTEKERSISAMKERLVEMEESYASLLDDYNEQYLISSLQDEALHKVYFAYGTSKELESQMVMEKKGGVLGIGKVKKLKDDFNKEYFTEVDMRELAEIELDVKEAELLTQHPEESYELVMEGEDMVASLVITDPTRFWSTSKYMALVVE